VVEYINGEDGPVMEGSKLTAQLSKPKSKKSKKKKGKVSKAVLKHGDVYSK
jgi:hypothetical protein